MSLDHHTGSSVATERTRVELGPRSYDVVVGAGLIGDSASFAALARPGQAMIVSNETVAPLLADTLQRALAGSFKTVSLLTLPDGESHKHWGSVEAVLDALITARADRGAVLFALGGGVVGDITGFAAACYMRGIDFVQVPTTLLAQVDSSVGGKTAINHARGKNMIGAFHQPRHVVADVSVLRTLPRRELVAGLAEVIKYGAVLDARFLDWIEAHLADLLALDPAALAYAVRRSCQIKAEVVAADEFEAGPRALLNFGHTFGHAIELGLGFGVWLHGEAVGCGMVLAAELSVQLGLIEPARAARLERIVAQAGLPTRPPPIGARRLVDLMRVDKKTLEGRQRFVVLEGEHGSRVSAAPEALVEAVIDAAALAAK